VGRSRASGGINAWTAVTLVSPASRTEDVRDSVGQPRNTWRPWFSDNRQLGIREIAMTDESFELVLHAM
jgi:hypothetical protein